MVDYSIPRSSLARGARSEPRRALPPRLGLLIACLSALLFLALLGPLMSVSGIPMAGEGSPIRQYAYVVIMGLVIYAVRPATAPERILVVPWPTVLALLWCWLTLTWAIAPDIAVRRLFLTTVVIWALYATTRNLGYERSLLIVRIGLLLCLACNYIAVLGWPEFAIHQFDEAYDLKLIGDWRGIMQHKNFAGAICGLTILFFLFDPRKMPLAFRAVVIAAATFFLVKSGSRTSLGDCAASVAIGSLFLSYNARFKGLLIAAMSLASTVIILLLTVYHKPWEAQFLDKTALTGRPVIWATLASYSSDHPMGAGFGSFWNIGSASPIYTYASNWVAAVAAAHNGYLDMVIQISLVGMLLVVFASIVWPMIRLFSVRSVSPASGALIFSTILFCLIHNFTETSIYDRDATGQVFLTLAAALLWSLTAKNEGVRQQRGGSRSGRLTEARSFPW